MELRDGKKLKRRSDQGSSRRPTTKVPDSVATTTIEDLPPELLVKIFTHCIEVEGHVKFAKNVAPVCKTWWDLSWTPSLWKSIDLQDSNSLLSFSNGRLSLKTPHNRSSANKGLNSLDHDLLLGLLTHIRGVNTLVIDNKAIDVNTMAIVAKHCPDLENLHMKLVTSAGFGQLTLQELHPILSTCGPKLKHINFDCCEIGESEQLIAEIAAKCTSLEILECSNGCGYFKFPIYKLGMGCPRLRILVLSKCELVGTRRFYFSGFKDLKTFKATFCNFSGLDVCRLLKNSENLDYLELFDNCNMVFSNPSKIPSNSVRFLKLSHVNLVPLERAVNKWKHTLLHLRISSFETDVTSALKIYSASNPCFKLEVLCVEERCVDRSFLKMFLMQCENLKVFKFDDYTVRYEIVKKFFKFRDSL